MYKCIAVDDDLYALNELQGHISKTTSFILLKKYTDPQQALVNVMAGDVVDVIFLDIDMPSISGIELASEFKNKARKIVFVTSHMQYGYDAFEVDAAAYLLKPYTFSKFAITLNKLFPKQVIEAGISHYIEDPFFDKSCFFFVKSKEEDLQLVKIRYDDVIMIESKQNYICIYTNTKKITTYFSLTEILKNLESKKYFVQIQRSFIISLPYIDSILGNHVKMTNGRSISVGESYRKPFQSFVASNTLKWPPNFT